MALLDLLEPLLVHWQTILIASAIFLVYFYWIVPYRAARAIYPKGPIPLPFIGHLWDTVKHKGLVHLQMNEYCKKYGQVYSMLTFGSKPCIIISDPEMLRDIFVKEFGSFADRPVSSTYINLLSITVIATDCLLLMCSFFSFCQLWVFDVVEGVHLCILVRCQVLNCTVSTLKLSSDGVWEGD